MSSPAFSQAAPQPHHLGASDETAHQLLRELRHAGPDVTWGRVCRVDRGRALVLTGDGETVAVPTVGAPVAVGDWCVLRGAPEPSLVTVLERTSQLVRRAAGPDVLPQVLAVNVDLVLIVVPLDRPLSRRYLERMCAVAWDGGTQPIAVVTKSDLAHPSAVAEAVATARSVSSDLDAVAVSAEENAGLDDLSAVLGPGVTAVLLGASGAGKSTLMNALAGSDVATGEVREVDGKGRHTTTWRELVVLPEGGALIDTPGMRELGLWVGTDGLNATFADVLDLQTHCRFSDCAHAGEPGCAVAEAIASGELTADRLSSYQKLQREAAYVARQNDQRLAKEFRKQTIRRTRDGKSRERP